MMQKRLNATVDQAAAGFPIIARKPAVGYAIDWINVRTNVCSADWGAAKPFEKNGTGRWGAAGACKAGRETEEQTLPVRCMIN